MPSNESFPHIDPAAEPRRTDEGFLSKSEARRFAHLTEGMDAEKVETIRRRRSEQVRAWQESKDQESLEDFIARNNQSRAVPLQ